jgi:hypothetical protein
LQHPDEAACLTLQNSFPARAASLKRAAIYHVLDRALPLGRSLVYAVALGGISAFMEGYMRIVILAAAVAVACTSFATAGEVKKDTTKAPAPVVASKTMTETDMDKVTAGDSGNAAYVSCCYYLTTRNGSTHQVNYHAYNHGFQGYAY